MNEQQSSHFRIGDDEESPDSLFQAEINEQRIDKLSQRVTLFSILIPGLVCILLFVAYLDVKKRFISVQGTGEKEVQNLSKNLESSYSTLSLQFAKLEESLKVKVSDIENAAASLKKDLNKTSSSLADAIKSVQSSKAGKKDLAGAVAKIDNHFIPIREDLKKIASDMNSLETNTKQDLENLVSAVEQVKTELKKFQTQLSSLSSDRIDQKTLELALKAEQQSFQQKLNQASKNFETKIALTQEKISDLEKLLRLYREKQEEKVDAPAPTQPQAETPAPPEKPVEKPPLPKPGKIIEQDIQ